MRPMLLGVGVGGVRTCGLTAPLLGCASKSKLNL